MSITSAKIDEKEKARKPTKIPLDTSFGKRGRGRPRKIQPSWVIGTANNYRWIFDQTWADIWLGLSKAETQEDVANSFSIGGARAYASNFVPMAQLILQVLRDRKFPKQNREAQIHFLADSIAAHGVVTPRSSRDICERERARAKQKHHILYYEFYIGCSCGYTGYSRSHACPTCGARIHLEADSPFDTNPIP